MPRRLTADDLAAIAVPESPALSPDGTRVVYVLRQADLDADRDVRRLWTVPVDGGAEPAALTDGPADTAPTWAPDGRRLALLRPDAGGSAQLWLLDVDDPGAAVALTALPLGAGPAAWSPDGRTIAFTASVDRAAVAGEDDAARARRAYAPIVADRLSYVVEGPGIRGSVRDHVHVVDVATGACTQLTDGDWDAGAPAWSPDGALLAFPAATDPDADLKRTRSAHVLDPFAPGAHPREVGAADGWAGPLGWTEDGSALLIAGTPAAPNGHYGLLRVALAGGATTNLAAPLDRNVMFGSPGYPGTTPRTAGDGATVLFCATERGDVALHAVPADGSAAPTVLVGGTARNVSAVTVAAGRAAFTLTSAASFGEVASLDLATGVETVLTAHSAASLAGIEPFGRTEREFTISDGTVVHAWLMRDPAAPPGPQPLLVDAHGGPHNSWKGTLDEVHLYHQELVAQGWTILLVNPRGSDGYGEAFYRGAAGGWGVEDANDFLEPIDALVAEGAVDPDRLALTGYSYGGFMTCYLTSRDPRFAAAVAGGIISDLTSMAGTADNRRGLSESQFGGRFWADRARYAQQSPLTHVEDVQTPTLVLQGGADRRCPFGQGQQWHTALRELGVPTQLVIYPDAVHNFTINGRPSHRIDLNRRVVDWVTTHAA
ncbi:Dipeptidyl-peptidase 5 [Baekduia alba]|uniref:S9 family peptidase n=1 Tax=Baekduia alba TaxID=2997333 RepID=UPI00233F7F37|nr:S9 family peptidase [Baekduia alba]WCB95147.1 Dipeptidyl-peptidase 5 [Baekduia alba]